MRDNDYLEVYDARLQNNNERDGALSRVTKPFLTVHAAGDKIYTTQLAQLFDELAADRRVLVRAGGSTQNTARVAQALLGPQHDVTFVGCVGDDKWGGAMKQAAIEDGLRDIVYEAKAAASAVCAMPRNYVTPFKHATSSGLSAAEHTCIANLGVTAEFQVRSVVAVLRSPLSAVTASTHTHC